MRTIFFLFAVIAVALALAAPPANAQGFSLRQALDIANTVSEMTQTQKPAEQAPSAEETSKPAIGGFSGYMIDPRPYAKYVNYVTVYDRTQCDDVTPTGTQAYVSSFEDMCVKARNLDNTVTITRCQELLTYEGSYATQQSRNHNERLMQKCAATYDADMALADTYADVIAGKQINTRVGNTSGKGSVTRF